MADIHRSSLAIAGDAFDSYNTPTFKTEVLRLVSNEGWLKCLLLLYKRLVQPYLSLL